MVSDNHNAYNNYIYEYELTNGYAVVDIDDLIEDYNK